MKFSNLITRPLWLVLIPALVSFLVWVTPWSVGVRRGFEIKEPNSVWAIVTLAAWYGMIATLASVGWFAGRQTSPNPTLDDTDDDRVYKIITIISVVGVVGMYLLITAQSPGLMIEAFQTQQFNQVKEAIPGTPGLTTLRYASILGGAIAAHRLVVMRQPSKLHALNIVLLVMNVAVASRLALIMTLVLFAGLWAVRRPPPTARRVSKVRVMILVLVALGVLVEANYVRNANFYRDFYGISNPVVMAGSEAISYVGSPTQVAVATTHDGTVKRTTDQKIDGIARLMTPSFFTSAAAGGSTNSAWYRGKVSIEGGLTTNSALASIYGQVGLGWAFAAMAAIALIAGWIMGHLSRYRSYMALGSFVAGYCFVEVWRVYLFAEGIVWFLVLVLAFACWQGRSKPVAVRRALSRSM